MDMTYRLPLLEQLAVDVTELLDRCDTATSYIDERRHITRVHATHLPGLLRQTSADRSTLTRAGEGGGRRAPGSRPPGRLDILTLPDDVLAWANQLRRRLRPGSRRCWTVADALRDLVDLAIAQPRLARDIASEVASWKGTALVALGYADPPTQTRLRCLHCGVQLVAPQTDEGRYLLCPNRDCRDAEGRRHRWAGRDVPLLLAGQPEPRAS